MAILLGGRRDAGGISTPWMSPSDARVSIPYPFVEAVELWARSRGRHGTIGWSPVMRCPVVELSLKSDDPRMKAYKEGRLKREPKEAIPLHFQIGGGPFQAIDLEQLGVSGLTAMLDKADMWSGRGEYNGMIQAVRAVEVQNEKHREAIRAAARDNARERAKDMRRQIFDLPIVTVPDNIGARNGKE